jgi:MFS family permease
MSVNDSTTTIVGSTVRTRAFAALGHRNYRLFWIGGLISNAGRFFQVLAIPVIIWQLTESAGWVGLAGFAQVLPMALVAPVAGVLADRHDRRRYLLFTQTTQGVMAAVFMILWWSGVRSPGVFVAVSVLAGLAAGLNLPAWQAFVSELVPRELLLNAVTLNSMQFNSSRMIGPVLAGLTIASVGAGWAFFVNFATYGAVLVALALIDTPGVARSADQPIQPIRDLGHTVRYVAHQPGIRTAVITVSLIGMFGLPVQTLSVVFAEDVFDRGPSGFGVMLTSLGAGAVLVAPVVAGLGGRVARSRIQGLAIVAYSCAVVGFALAPTFLLSLVALMAMGAAHLTSASTLNTAIQIQVDEERRAKVLSLYLMVLMLSNPVGQLVLGQLIEAIGPRETMLGAGLVMFVGAIILRLSGRLTALDQEGGTYAPDVVPEAHPTLPVPPRE